MDDQPQALREIKEPGDRGEEYCLRVASAIIQNKMDGLQTLNVTLSPSTPRHI